MKAIWNCLASKGMYDMKKLCGHWNVYIGWKIPKRIDLRCKKCGTRHQFRPARTSTRGRKSKLQWLAFPDDSLQEELQRYANRRNGLFLPQPGFQTALDVHLESPREQIRAHLQKVVSPVGGESVLEDEKPKLRWWRRLLGFFFRKERSRASDVPIPED